MKEQELAESIIEELKSLTEAINRMCDILENHD